MQSYYEENYLHCDGRFISFGAGNETRTRDPNLGKVVLYQLSYFRLFWTANITQFSFFQNAFLV